MRTRYGISFWLDRLPASRRPTYPRHRGHLDVDVAIVGGGLTGCAVAYGFVAAGIKTALFEADRIAAGSTVASAGLLFPDPAVEFQQLEKLYGLRATRGIYQATRRAALDLAATLRRLNVKCDLASRDLIYLALTPEEEKRLRREAQARRVAGLDAAWLTPKKLQAETAVAAHGGIRLSGGATLDPFRACLGLARAAAERGALLFERSAVRRIRTGRKLVQIRTEGGDVRANRIIIVTNTPGAEFRPLGRHFRRLETYLTVTEPMPADVRRQVGRRDAMLRDAGAPSHFLGWLKEDRVLFGGADQPETAIRARAKVLVQRTGQLMYELSRIYPAISGMRPEYGWSARHGQTVDGLPFIGPHRNYPRHLFALGYGRNGLAHAFLASRILLRRYRDEAEKTDELFGFNRVKN